MKQQKLEEQKKLKQEEKELKLKEENERKQREVEEKERLKPSIVKFLKPSANKPQGEQREISQELESVVKANNMFTDYLCKDSEAIKIQIDNSIKFGDIRKKRQISTEFLPNTAEFERANKQMLCDYFKIMKNLDEYVAKADCVKIRYPKFESEVQLGQVIVKNPNIKVINRRKHIIIEDYQKIILPQNQTSKLLSCRNPFRMDDQIINYDLDTEDEMEEQNGEDLNEENNQSMDDDDDLQEQELQKGFIVDDDYFSVSDLNCSDNEDGDQIDAERERKKQMLIKAREIKQKCSEAIGSGPCILLVSENELMAAEYEAVCMISGDFPVSQQKCKLQQYSNDDNEDKKLGLDPNAIESRLAELVRFAHGSLESKVRIIEEFNEKFPDCSKNQIERKLKDSFVKDKKGEDPKHRLYASESLLVQLKDQFPEGVNSIELVDLARSRIQPLLDEMKQQQEELEQKKQIELQ